MHDRNKMSVLAISAMAFALVGGLLFAGCSQSGSFRNGDHLVTWEIYHGDLPSEKSAGYQVKIDEADHGKGLRRLVFLKTYGAKQVSAGITGHDYDADGVFDRVFYCGDHELIGSHPKGWGFGCNSVLRTSSGWKFEPCSGDEGIVKPFSDRAIAFALAELNRAVYEVHTEDHLSERWAWNPDIQRVVKVFDQRS